MRVLFNPCRISNHLSFKAGVKPYIYAVKDDLSCDKFQGTSEIQEKLGINPKSVSGCLCGHIKKTKNYYFFKASEIESKDDNGNFVLDNDKLKAKISEVNNIPDGHKGKVIPVYSVDEKGNYKKFANEKEAAEYYGMEPSNMRYHMSHGGGKNQIFVFASKLEKKDENGNIIIDTTALKELQIKAYELKNENTLYAIHKNGTYERYNSQLEASEKLGIAPSRISNCITGRKNTAGDYTFVKALDVQVRNDDGSYYVDEEKINEILIQKFSRKHLKEIAGKPVYAVGLDGKYKKFDDISIAGRELNISEDNIIRFLQGEFASVGRYKFVKASEVEDIQPDGSILINQAKINELSQGIRIKNSPVYLVDENGNYDRYTIQREAAEKIGVACDKISSGAKGIRKIVKGYVIIYASDVETKQPDGTYKLDIDKLNVINKERRTRKHIEKFRPDFNKPRNTNSDIPKIKPQKPKTVKPANKPDIQADKKPVNEIVQKKQKSAVNQIKSEKPVKQKEIKNKTGHELYAVNKKGKLVQYSGVTEASMKLGISPAEIVNCVSGVTACVKGLKFIYAKNIEKILPDGTSCVDKDKLNDIVQSFTPEVKPINKIKQLPSYIYVMTRKGRVLKFNSSEQIEKETKIPAFMVEDSLDKPECIVKGCIFLSAGEAMKLDENGSYVDDKDKLKRLYYEVFGNNKKE